MGLETPPLTDVAAHLRAIADDVEAGRRLKGGGSAVVILDDAAGPFELLAYGETHSALVAAALATAGVKLSLVRLRTAGEAI